MSAWRTSFSAFVLQAFAKTPEMDFRFACCFCVSHGFDMFGRDLAKCQA